MSKFIFIIFTQACLLIIMHSVRRKKKLFTEVDPQRRCMFLVDLYRKRFGHPWCMRIAVFGQSSTPNFVINDRCPSKSTWCIRLYVCVASEIGRWDSISRDVDDVESRMMDGTALNLVRYNVCGKWRLIGNDVSKCRIFRDVRRGNGTMNSGLFRWYACAVAGKSFCHGEGGYI